MNIEQLYRDFHIPYVTGAHKHAREGWINVECPFCTGNAGFHLGYNIEGNHYVCWRCGSKPLTTTIQKLLNVSYSESITILKTYSALLPTIKQKEIKIKLKTFKLPPGSEALSESHKKYLKKRKYDPDELESTWGLLSTGIYSRMDKIDYSRRIVIPYYWNGKIVSFDTRDITGKSQNKYMACGEKREIINHKHILYGLQNKWKSVGICVEGTTDVWRMGVNSFATSGIKFTPYQVRTISKHFKRVGIAFDPEVEATKQAKKLQAELRFRGVDAFIISLPCDPGDLPQDEADYIVKQVIY